MIKLTKNTTAVASVYKIPNFEQTFRSQVPPLFKQNIHMYTTNRIRNVHKVWMFIYHRRYDSTLF